MGLLRSNIVALMDFMVLGPLRVEDAGRVIPLGGPKQRTVLALLIASPGHAVSTDSLLIGAYGLDADPRARRSIQTWISDYRRQLNLVIERRGDGYVLNLEPAAIDAGLFEERVRTANQAKHEDVAAEILREALALWRGRPYSNVEPARPLEAEARRLEALRTEALDRRIGLDFGAGRHRKLLPELETLVTEHPHDESLRAHHMVALYRCGRQADALRAYRSAETILREELGVDPSPELRFLEQRILAQDHALDYRPKPRTRPIPQRYTSFVGRADELSQVRDLVLGERLITVTGAGGVGKSSLAVEVARSLVEEFPTVFAPIEANRDADPWRVVANSLGLDGGGDAELPRLVADAIGDTTMLLLLDGCEHVLERVTHLVAALLSASANLRILMTSRESIAMTGERLFTLQPLESGAGSPANRLFLERAGWKSEALSAEALDQVSTIGRRVSGLPLGLELAAARTRTLDLDDIAARLDDQVVLLETKRGAVAHQRSIVAALDWSYDLLPPESQAALRRLGAFPTGRLVLDAAAHIWETDDPLPHLGSLVDASLVSAPDSSHPDYTILEPVRQYAAMRLADSGELDGARLRYAEWVVTACESAQVALLGGDLWGATRMIRDNAPSIAATAVWAADHGHPEVVLGIIAAVGRLWPRVADPLLLIKPGRAAIDDPGGTDRMLWLRALAHLAFLHSPGRPPEARALLARLGEEVVGDEDLLTQHVVSHVKVSTAYRLHRGADADEATVRRWMQLDEEATEALRRMGYPLEPTLYRRAAILGLTGDLAGQRAVYHRLVEWAGDEHTMWRGMALHVIAKLQYLEGDTEAGVASAKEAARSLVDGGDLDFAAEAEYILAGLLCRRGAL